MAVDLEGSRGAEHQLGIGSQNAHAILDMFKPFRPDITRNRLILCRTVNNCSRSNENCENIM